MIYSIVEQTIVVLGVTLQYVNVLYVTILCLGAGVIAAIILPRLGYEWCALRRVPAMDVMDEAVRICAEKGRPFFQSAGSSSFSAAGGGIQFVESIVSLGRYLTKQCANLGVRFISAVMDPQLQLLFIDFARQGYLEAGRPELFNARDIKYVVSGVGQSIMENVDTIRMNKPAAFVGIGHFGSGTPVPIFEEAVTQGAFIVGSSYWPDELAQAAMASDYTLLTAEQTIIGAYIDNDPEKMAVFIGEDVAKLILIAIAVIIGIAWIAGTKLIPQTMH